MFFNYVYCFVCFILLRIVMSFSLAKETTADRKENNDLKLLNEVNVSLMTTMLSNTTTMISNEAKYNISKIRAKRQSGAGKFTDAAKMPQVKIMRLFLQMFKNFWDSAYIGGSHPLHPNVPKTVLTLYRQKIVEFFVPDVGEDPNKPMA